MLKILHNCLTLQLNSSQIKEDLMMSSFKIFCIHLNMAFLILETVVRDLSEKCPYQEYFWSLFSSIRTEYLSVFCPNARKYGPEKFRIRTLFKQCMLFSLYPVYLTFTLFCSCFFYVIPRQFEMAYLVIVLFILLLSCILSIYKKKTRNCCLSRLNQLFLK